MLTMLKSLKMLATQTAPLQVELVVQDRLPFFVQGECKLNCEFQVTKESNYYLLSSKVQGSIPIQCQFCLDEFQYAYHHQHDLAICLDDRSAEKVMAALDCTVQSTDEVDLLAIVTDDLHLFCPQRHEDSQDCDFFVS